MKIGINGTGLITRAIIKLVTTQEEFANIEIEQINGRSMTLKTLHDQILFSTAHGHSDIDVEIDEDKNQLIVNGTPIKYTRNSQPEEIEWSPDIQLLIDASGAFRNDTVQKNNPYRFFDAPSNNLRGVILSAPGKGNLKDYMWLATPNLEQKIKQLIDQGDPFVFGAGSCTTTATIPIFDTLDDFFGMESCYLKTIQACNRSQALLDGSNGWSALDTQLRSTGATISTNRVLEKDVPMDGIAYRTNDKAGSFIQIDAVVRKEVTKESILKAFEQSKYKDSIDYPKVSNPPSSYVLGNHNMVLLLPEKISIIGKKRAIVRGLYDNETGYAYHFLTLIKHVISLLEE